MHVIFNIWAPTFIYLFLKNLHQASTTVGIPKEHHRFVIGKNGEKLQELELKTATKIQIPRPDDPSNQIKISGTKEGLEKAKHEILLISAEQVRLIWAFSDIPDTSGRFTVFPWLSQDKRAVERVNIEKVYHPFITGAYNKLVGELMQETGARINVPPPSVNKTEVVITGEKEQVALAMVMIKKIFEEKVGHCTLFTCYQGPLFCYFLTDCFLFVIQEKEYHHYRSRSKEISAQVCDWPQGKHPTGNSG